MPSDKETLAYFAITNNRSNNQGLQDETLHHRYGDPIGREYVGIRANSNDRHKHSIGGEEGSPCARSCFGCRTSSAGGRWCRLRHLLAGETPPQGGLIFFLISYGQ
jgi:hypothetical protein